MDGVTPERELSNGMKAQMRFAGTGGWQLVVDGTPQSHVDPDRPDILEYEYVLRIGHVIDALEPGPITAVHLGAGALTIPRYVAHTRKGSRQQVLELEPALVELVREVAPLPRDASIRVRYGDARALVERLPPGLHRTVDLVVVDVFAGSQTPAHVTTVEFHRLLQSLLSPRGVVVVNVADGRALQFARSQVATLREVYAHVAGIADTGFLKGRRFGNLVAIAADSPLPTNDLPAVLARDPFPSKLLSGSELQNFAKSGAPARDATATASPAPNSSVFGGLR